MYYYGMKGLLYLCLLCLIFTAATCVENAEPGPTAEDFTKQNREALGDLLAEVIAETPDEFPLLSRLSKRDSVITTYLQTLYNQATQDIRADRQATPSNKWNIERDWRVIVLHDPVNYVFSTPGGHFYISTGFLKALSKGYEIYYLMAFEAINIAERYLIDNLISEYGTAPLLELIENKENVSNATLLEVVETLKNELVFSDDIIKEIDRKTGELICETSIFDRFGVQTLLETSDNQQQWRDTRPSYSNRLAYIKSLNIDGCGTIKSTGLYEKMVLDNLPK